MSQHKTTGYVVIAAVILALLWLLSRGHLTAVVASKLIQPDLTPGGAGSNVFDSSITPMPPGTTDIVPALEPGPTYPYFSCPQGYALWKDVNPFTMTLSNQGGYWCAR